MNIYVTVLLFVIGVALTVKGGDIFVDAASWIAEISGIPKFVVGATIVSLATTLPELLVSAIAAAQGKVDMAIGNAVGSVTVNTGLILGLGLLFMPIVFKRRSSWKPCALLVAACTVLWLGCLPGSLQTWAAVLLLVILALYIAYNLHSARGENRSEARPAYTKKELWTNIGKFVLGAAAIVGGSQLLVSSGSDLAKWLGVPERIIAVTLVSIGTSLPELVTAITAIVKKQSSLSVGNIIGANVIDLTLILPVCALVSGGTLPVAATSLAVDIPVCLGILLCALVPLLWRERGGKVQGAAIIALYIGYLAYIL